MGCTCGRGRMSGPICGLIFKCWRLLLKGRYTHAGATRGWHLSWVPHDSRMRLDACESAALSVGLEWDIRYGTSVVRDVLIGGISGGIAGRRVQQ